MSGPELFGYIIIGLFGFVLLLCAFAGGSRINGDDENAGSETGVERESEMKPWEGWK